MELWQAIDKALEMEHREGYHQRIDDGYYVILFKGELLLFDVQFRIKKVDSYVLGYPAISLNKEARRRKVIEFAVLIGLTLTITIGVLVLCAIGSIL